MTEKLILRNLKYRKILKLDIVEQINTLTSNLEVMKFIFNTNDDMNKEHYKKLKQDLRILKMKYLDDEI